MAAQLPSTITGADLDLGNAILYFNPTPFQTLAAAVAATTWRKLGLMGEGVRFNVNTNEVKFYSGFPASLQQKYYASQDVMIAGKLLELEPRKIAMLMGGATLTETVHATSPAPTTVATGSTKTAIKCASVTGYAVNDQIRVGTGTYQYGRVQAIDTVTKTLTLYEGLSGDAVPTVGQAVAKILRTYFPIGNLSAPASIAAKISKTTIGGYGTSDIYILKAQVTPQTEMVYTDDNQTPEKLGMPFTLEGIKDPNVENGAIAFWDWNH